MTEQEQLEQMRTRSGTVDSNNQLVGFLYVLMRDYVTPGVVEDILLRQCSRELTQYTNGWLASYAKDVANRLQEERA